MCHVGALPTVSIIGAGNVGTACAASIVARGIADVRLLDILADEAAAKAMDINHAAVAQGSSCRVSVCDSLHALNDSRIVVFSAGSPRRSGMNREDLLKENWQVLCGYCEWIAAHCPHAVVLVITNPVNILTTLIAERFGRINVLGMGCCLDTVRFRYYLGRAAGAAAQTVDGLVVGSHDRNMLPLTRLATIGGARADEVLTREQLTEVVEKTRQAGNVILAKMKTRGSWYAGGVIAADIVNAVLTDSRRVFPVSVRCPGQPGLDGACLSLPARVGAHGAETVLTLDLEPDETRAIERAARGIAQAVRSTGAGVSAAGPGADDEEITPHA